MIIINVRIADPDNKRAHNSLNNWLNNNQYIKENAQLKLPDSAPEGMGPGFDVIQLVLNWPAHRIRGSRAASSSA